MDPKEQLRLLDVSRDVEAAITETNISNELCSEIIQELDLSEYTFDDWTIEFIDSNIIRKTFSPAQKKVIYKLARKYQLI